MSADNFIGIIKGKDGTYKGYHLSASAEYDKTEIERIEKNCVPLFTAKDHDIAFDLAEKEEDKNCYEYDISFLDGEDENRL